MSITDELREWLKSLYTPNSATVKDEGERIADRIDAEHEKAMSRAGQLLADAEKDRDYNYANWQDCKQKVLQHNITMDELSTEIERLKDELAHRIELPKDADGEHIHVGDVMEWPTTGETFEVVGIGEGTLFYVEDGSECADWTGASTKRHHHAPTVEDVLREMLDAWGELPSNATNEAIVAEYASKLRLAEGEDA